MNVRTRPSMATTTMFLIVMLLFGNVLVLPSQSQAQDLGLPHVTIEVVDLTINSTDYQADDWSEEAETKLIIVGVRTCENEPTALPLPVTGTKKARPGTPVHFGGTSLGICVSEATERLYVQLVAIDDDTILGDSSIDKSVDVITSGLSDLLASRAVKLFKLTRHPLEYVALLGTSLFFEEGAQYLIDRFFTKHDIMGEVTLDLQRSQDWQADGLLRTVSSPDGAVTFTYRVRMARPADQTSPIKPTVKNWQVITDVNLRTGPGRSYGVIRVLKAGTIVQALGEQDGWVQVKAGSDVGWIGGWEYLRPAP